jgi:phosphate transport system substrate-binding protein
MEVFMKKNGLKLMVSALATTMMIGLFTGCGNKDGGETNNTDNNAAQTEKLSGTIQADGSSTVGPITEAMAEEFNKEYPDVQIPVAISGTGGGFKRFVLGETDIQNASRPVKDEEKQKATENGVEMTEFIVAYDGITICVSNENDFVDTLTVAELNKMWAPDSTVKTWKDVRAEWPAEPIKFYSPGPDSGTFEFFTEAINKKAKAMRPDVNPSEDDNTLVQGIAGDKNAIGFFGYAYYEANNDKVKAVKVDAGTGAVEPSLNTIKDGSYKPLSRPIFVYVNNKSFEKPQVKEFVKFYLENAAAIVPELGEVALPEDEYKEQLNKIK